MVVIVGSLDDLRTTLDALDEEHKRPSNGLT
jgi:hypothetical protein